MNTSALLYRPNARWQIWLAFGCAAALHLGAIALARSESDAPMLPPPAGDDVPVSIDTRIDETPSQPEELQPTVPVDSPKGNEAISEDRSTPGPIRPKNTEPVPRFVESTHLGRVSAPSFGSFKTLAIYAPRPPYPYEARQRRTMGSGVVALTIDSVTGAVIDAHMVQTTGSAILDNSSLSAFRRWRFKPGTVTKVQVPITYKLTGASY